MVPVGTEADGIGIQQTFEVGMRAPTGSGAHGHRPPADKREEGDRVGPGKSGQRETATRGKGRISGVRAGS